MAKYDPLRDHLLSQRNQEFTLTFAEIEAIFSDLLPKSAERPEWWANEKSERTTHVQRNAWRDAGYDAFLQKGRERVTFRKTKG
ncbi:DUF7662 domain-containing protein [Terrihabitans sp. B22-R8]|uniref:DUF7662 domain-containing protein n=1 Tax=Terrihabitans sp. B22-R8 TaxID=3425128 RepID=UPI00403CD4D6